MPDMLMEQQSIEVSGSDSILGFATTGGGAWQIWDRYLTVYGKKAYHIGNICNTCTFFFERLEGANKNISADAIAGALQVGIARLDADVVAALTKILPNEKYQMLLLRVLPQQVQLGGAGDYFSHEQIALWGMDGFWGLPHSPKIQYYRLPDLLMSATERLFQFVVPMFPASWLDSGHIQAYVKALSEGREPTAVALSILDIKAPAYCEDDSAVARHWCLTHYLLDGHHKMQAAAKQHAPITLLSFLAVGQGISSETEISRLVSILAEVAHSGAKVSS